MSIGERHLFSWLHLSDLHFGHGDETYAWDQRSVLASLETDVRIALSKWPELPGPQAIMVTGDVAFSGGVRAPDEYNNAAAFLGRLITQLDISPDQVYIVPGNHDVQRDVARPLVDRVRENDKELDVLMRSPVDQKEFLTRQSNYISFADGFAKRDLAAWREIIPIAGFGKIEILGVNTALLCNDDNDRGRLQLTGGQRQLLSQPDSDCAVRLVLTHHPLEDGWLRDEAILRSMAQKATTAHLCGHLHDAHVDLTAPAGGQLHVRVIAAAAHRDPKEAGSDKTSHGYNFGSLMLNADGFLVLRTWPRRWFPLWNEFRVDHLGVRDRQFYDDKSFQTKKIGSGLVLDPPDQLRFGGVHWWGDPQINWSALLHGKSRLEVFGIAVRDFLEPNITQLTAFMASGGKVHVVLADPRSKISMARYDEDFNKDLGDRTRKVLESLALLNGLGHDTNAYDGLRVSLTPHHFKYSAYRIDGTVLFVPYRMTPGKQPAKTPALVFDRGSRVVERFLGPDLDRLRDGAAPLTLAQLQSMVTT